MMERGPLSPVHLQSSRTNFSPFPTTAKWRRGQVGSAGQRGRDTAVAVDRAGPLCLAPPHRTGRRMKKGQGKRLTGEG